MRSAVVASALCGLVAAAPKPAPQNFNLAALAKLATPSVLGPELAATTTPAVTYNPTEAAQSAAAAISTAPAVANGKRALKKRTDDCPPQPAGSGPIPGDGSVDAYLDTNSVLAQTALNATCPQGYTESFKALTASTQQIGYLTYKTLDQYNVQACADFCDSEKFCLGFNIYYERDPTIDPATAQCANPPPTTNIKCAIYGYPVASGSATNNGQWRGPEDASGEAFHVVIAGSNGYSKLNPCRVPQTQTDFSGPVALPAAINAPTSANSYTGMKLYNEGPFDPSVCAAACKAQTEFDREHLVDANGNYDACNFFNVYILTKNDVPQGTYCSFYTQEWDMSYAVNTGYSWENDVYAVKASFSYTLSQQDPGHI